ncbi:MAG: DUF2959 family protein [Phycisphaeraceae bacterium]
MNRVPLYVAFLLPLLMVGCETLRGFERAEMATSDVRLARTELVGTQEQLDRAVASLNALVAAEAERQPRFQSFSEQVDTLDRQVDRLRTQVEEMEAQVDAYFTAWEAEIDQMESEALRNRAMRRRASSIDSYQVTMAAYQDVDVILTPLVSKIRDQQRYLGSDLTASGVGSVSDIIEEVRQQEHTAQQEIEAAILEFNRIASELSTAAAE